MLLYAISCYNWCNRSFQIFVQKCSCFNKVCAFFIYRGAGISPLFRFVCYSYNICLFICFLLVICISKILLVLLLSYFGWSYFFRQCPVLTWTYDRPCLHNLCCISFSGDVPLDVTSASGVISLMLFTLLRTNFSLLL